MGRVSVRVHVDAIGYGFVGLNSKVGFCVKPIGGILSAPLKKARTSLSLKSMLDGSSVGINICKHKICSYILPSHSANKCMKCINASVWLSKLSSENLTGSNNS